MFTALRHSIKTPLSYLGRLLLLAVGPPHLAKIQRPRPERRACRALGKLYFYTFSMS